MLIRLFLLSLLVLAGCSKSSQPETATQTEPEPEPETATQVVYNDRFLYYKVWNRPANIWYMPRWAEFYGSGVIKKAANPFIIGNATPPVNLNWYHQTQIYMDGASYDTMKTWLADAAIATTPPQTVNAPNANYFIEYGGSDPVSQKQFVIYQWTGSFGPTPPAFSTIVYQNPSQYTDELTALINTLFKTSGSN